MAAERSPELDLDPSWEGIQMKSFQLSVDFLFLRARRWHLPLVLLLLTMPLLLGIAASVPGCASFFRGALGTALP